MSDQNQNQMLDPLWMRRCARAVLICLLGFVLLMGVAMALYPGGNWIDPQAPGHRFLSNFFCDLTQPVSLSGVTNRLGAGFARFGMWCFAAALAGFFWLVPLHFAPAPTLSSRAPLGRWVRGLGECAVLGVAAVPLLPSETFGHLHGFLALTSGALGIVAALVAVIALCRSSLAARRLGFLGALALAVASFDAALFAVHLNDVGPPPLLLPAAQKLAALLLCAWVIGVAWPLQAARERRATRRP